MKIMQVKEYNRMEMMEYDKKCNELAEEWRQGNCFFLNNHYMDFITMEILDKRDMLLLMGEEQF